MFWNWKFSVFFSISQLERFAVLKFIAIFRISNIEHFIARNDKTHSERQRTEVRFQQRNAALAITLQSNLLQ